MPPHFDEIRALVNSLPPLDETAREQASARNAQLTKPAGSLGRLEELTLWLAAVQRRALPRIDHPRVAVFAGNHGVARRGVSAFPQDVTVQMVANFQRGGAAVNQLCRNADADLRVYELNLTEPTEDFTERPAMSEEECCRAMAYGMMAVEPGVDLLCVGEMGIGNTTSAAALAAGLFGGTGLDWAGPGTGVAGDALLRKIEVIDRGLARHADRRGDPLAILQCLGGRELAAMAGAVIAARMAGVPVLLDGFTTCVAAAVLEKMRAGALDHCCVAHCSAEPGHRRLLGLLDKRPLLDFGMRLGEASGAALAIPLLRAATLCHAGMATFAEAGVSAKDALSAETQPAR
ncbi:MAG TPA: nicotinate-nucleotide--dimethylbenzimidazole phosphoribosyltransferase [Dongiaceae bacterium]|nr:nicotinate-nucleotide--dimethylbenzimidazole phosphoribosyltransferase [Dongiaceae bacterium]